MFYVNVICAHVSIVDNQVFDGKSSPTKKEEIEDNVGLFTFVYIFKFHFNKSSDLSHRIRVTYTFKPEKVQLSSCFPKCLTPVLGTGGIGIKIQL